MKIDAEVGDIGAELPPPGPVDGRTWARFVARTRPQWELLGGKLMRQWRTSYALELADVVQVMLTAAVLAHQEYDPARGPKLATHVVWNACASAKRAIHNDRQVQTNDRAKAPSKAPLPVSYYDELLARRGNADPHSETLLERTPTQGDDPQAVALLAEHILATLELTRTWQERQVMERLLRGDSFEEAGRAAEFGGPVTCATRAFVAAAVCLSRAG